MHHVYQTKGFVLGSSNFGEANCSFRIFTKDLGLVKTSAQGIRLLKSKLRYSLHDFSYADISLVRGREQWRVVGASKHFSLHEVFFGNQICLRLVTRVFLLLDRLLTGEEKNEILFNHIEQAVLFLKNETLSSELLRNFEYVLVLRILHSLGYLGSSPESEIFVTSPYLDISLLEKMNNFNSKILAEINKSLKESQL